MTIHTYLVTQDRFFAFVVPLICTQQEFFYHFLLVSDSHTFNVHLKAELAGEITRLYEQEVVLDHDGDHDHGHGHGRNKKERDQGEDDHQGHDHDHGDKNMSWVTEGETCIRDGVTGFTGTMSKLKVQSAAGYLFVLETIGVYTRRI